LGNELNCCVTSLQSARGFRLIDLAKVKALADCTHTGPADDSCGPARKPIAHSLLAFALRLLTTGVLPLQTGGPGSSESQSEPKPVTLGVEPQWQGGTLVQDLLRLKDVVHQACKIDVAALGADVSELRSHIAMCAAYAASGTGHAAVERFAPFAAFVAEAEPTVQGLEAQLRRAQDLLHAVAVYCGEESSGNTGAGGGPTEPVEIFAALGQFVLDVEACAAACSST
jgi:hypothetical protein